MATTEAAERTPEVIEPRKESILVDAKEHKPAEQPKDQPDYVKTIDRMGNELGEMRKERKELLAAIESMRNPQPQVEQVTFEDNPQQFIAQAVGQAIEERLAPKLQVLESDLNQRKGQTFDQKLGETYPDWKETVNQDDFAEWVKSSTARTQMYMIADQNFDVDSAAELIKRFKQDQAEAKQSESGAIAAAGMVDGGGTGDGVKVYAASEVKHMMESDPDAYKRWLSSEGMTAYRDGRVDQNR